MQARLNRNHWQIILLMYAPFFLIVLPGWPDLKLALHLLAGPFSGMAAFSWTEGYWDTSWPIAKPIFAIMAFGLLFQILVRPGPMANVWRYIVWALCWFLWFFSAILSGLNAAM